MIKVGDTVVRHMAGLVMPLKVTEVLDDLVVCGAWTFDKATGAEVDAELGWGPAWGSGSYIQELQ